jgi:hypothetical protein
LGTPPAPSSWAGLRASGGGCRAPPPVSSARSSLASGTGAARRGLPRSRWAAPAASASPRTAGWEIFNRPSKGGLNGFTHFAVKAEAGDRVLDARVLVGDQSRPTREVAGLRVQLSAPPSAPSAARSAALRSLAYRVLCSRSPPFLSTFIKFAFRPCFIGVLVSY